MENGDTFHSSSSSSTLAVSRSPKRPTEDKDSHTALHALWSSVLDVSRQAEPMTAVELKDFVLDVQPQRAVGEGSTWKRFCASDRFTAYRNLLGVSVSYFLCFSTFVSLASLQSSINEAEGLGLTSLVVLNVTAMMANFVSPTILKLLGTKWSMLCGYLGMLVYVLANYHPRSYTLYPASIIVGFAFGPLYASLFTHVTTVAIHFAAPLKESPAYLIALFTGIFSFFYKSSYIPGNLASSLILRNNCSSDSEPELEVNGSLISMFASNESESAEFCNSTASGANLDVRYLYILVSVYVVMDLAAIVTLLLFVDNIQEKVKKNLSKKEKISKYLKSPVVSMLKVIVSWKMFLLSPMVILNTLMTSIALGLFTKLYVSDCIGVCYVGFVLMVYGSASALGGFLSGRLVKCLPQYLIVYFFSFLTLGSLLFLLLYWERRPNIYFPFLFIFVFGSCEGCWNAMSPTITGVLFSDRKEAAFSVNRVWFTIGFFVGFLATLLFPFRVVLWIVFADAALNCFTYFILTLKTQTREQLLPCCFSDKRKGKEEEEGEGEGERKLVGTMEPIHGSDKY